MLSLRALSTVLCSYTLLLHVTCTPILLQNTQETASVTDVARTNFDYESLMSKYGEKQRWVFDMINVAPVWSDNITGKGVRVRVNDDGVDRYNIHWQGRFDVGASCDGEENYLSQSTLQHGTSVASIVGAGTDDSSCAIGVAPEVTLSACYALKPNESFLGTKVETMDISQNSFEVPACRAHANTRSLRRTEADIAQCPFIEADYRPEYDPCLVCDEFSDGAMGYNGNDNLSTQCKEAIVKHCNSYYDVEKDACSEFLDFIIGGECNYVGLSTFARASIVKGITQGRAGLGIIYVFASGNSYFEGGDTNMKGYTSSRMTISVGAVGEDGMHAFYSTSGASIFVSAPAGDVEDNKRHYTAKVGGGCTESGLGTSFATPVVSGVIALMLEVNPGLGWRDVQGILAATSTSVTNDPLDDTVTVNSAGYRHSDLYGFGIINAAAAVEMSRTWANYGKEKLLAVDSGVLDYEIYDDASLETKSTITVLPTEGVADVQRQQSSDVFVVETVEVLLDISHFSRGDLKIKLTSPSMTESVLHKGKLPENNQLGSDSSWKMMTVKNWGEDPYGEWQLSIIDEKLGDFESCVDEAGFFVYYLQYAVSCQYIEKYKICLDGEYNNDFFSQGSYDPLKTVQDAYGRTMAEACCACGGGLGHNSVEDKLNHWTIAIYGRHEIAPTMSPTSSFTPSAMPTEQPSTEPTMSPSTVPSNEPSQEPTVILSTSPSLQPSLQPTLTASDSPTLLPSLSISVEPTSTASKNDTNNPSDSPTVRSSFPDSLQDPENVSLQEGTNIDETQNTGMSTPSPVPENDVTMTLNGSFGMRGSVPSCSYKSIPNLLKTFSLVIGLLLSFHFLL